MDYETYLNSREWRMRRKLVLELWGHRCCLCYSGEDLQVHHRTYARIGRELTTDLIVLCRDCHKRHHLSARIEGFAQPPKYIGQGVYDENLQ